MGNGIFPPAERRALLSGCRRSRKSSLVKVCRNAAERRGIRETLYIHAPRCPGVPVIGYIDTHRSARPRPGDNNLVKSGIRTRSSPGEINDTGARAHDNFVAKERGSRPSFDALVTSLVTDGPSGSKKERRKPPNRRIVLEFRYTIVNLIRR